MSKDFNGIICYWKDPGDGTDPNPKHDFGIVVGHLDEDNRTVLMRVLRGKESEFDLDKQGFTTCTFSLKEGRVALHVENDGAKYFAEVAGMVKEL